MYKCPTENCSKTRYSDEWVVGFKADGRPCTSCTWCEATLVKENVEVIERGGPAINTAGCTPVSNNYTH